MSWLLIEDMKKAALAAAVAAAIAMAIASAIPGAQAADAAIPGAKAADAAPSLPSQASILAGPCTSCHGAQGEGSGAIPTLHGRPAFALLEQLKAFRSEAVPSTVMGRLAKGYSDEQLALLAAYFGEK